MDSRLITHRCVLVKGHAGNKYALSIDRCLVHTEVDVAVWVTFETRAGPGGFRQSSCTSYRALLQTISCLARHRRTPLHHSKMVMQLLNHYSS